MIQLKERIGKLVDYLKEQIYSESISVREFRMLQSEEHFTDITNLDTSSWEHFDDREIWGGHREYFWFETSVTIPEHYEGKCVVFKITTGKEGQWDATNPQFTIFVNGEQVQGLDVNHQEIILAECGKAGECYRIFLSAFTGDQNFHLRLEASLKVLDLATFKYFYDIMVPYEAAKLLDSEDDAYIQIIRALNESLNFLDLRVEGSIAYYESLKEANDYLQKEFYQKYCNDSKAPVIRCVGHTHIDCAWLWTQKVTKDKAVRSFSTVLSLMKRYPEYQFMSSQPLLYQYVKKSAPELYEKIKERVAEGRWETEGGMFVEADCNLASGEALSRQILYGKRFFRKEFDKDNVILWLPDVFGYSAALPQIMKLCGIKYFMTTKISWNEFNRMPYDTFLWEGIDGTRILTHFMPTRNYSEPAEAEGAETAHFTTYNGYLNPSQMKGAWKRYGQKNLNGEVLAAFGYGDGGGGPTVDMLEQYRRMKKGIPGLPVTKMSSAREFFEKLDEDVTGSRYLPVWIGELYLEYHRGTYTSMGRNKKNNRRVEFAWQNGELYTYMNRLLAEGEYPRQELNNGWEILLKNQFHDILPGSSIKEVYEDSDADYKMLFANYEELKKQSLIQMVSAVNVMKGAVVVFNPNSMQTAGIVLLEMAEPPEQMTFSDGERIIPIQQVADGRYIFLANQVPSKGYRTYWPIQGQREETTLRVSQEKMENRFFSISFNEKGQFAKIYDKIAKRDVLKPGEAGNVIISYEDRPQNNDAWDVSIFYKEKFWVVDDLEEIEVLETGPVRATVRVSRRYLQSRIVQDISIYAELPRIDIRNWIDWKQHQIFLKDWFPIDVHATEATYEIQYGNVKRACNDNTSWDYAKFEVCYHKWLDVSEEGYGVSVLNDSKYGAVVRDGRIGLSMLKSAVYPNPDADKEQHEFIYSIYPHVGDWREADTIGHAYVLNNPMTAICKENDGGILPAEYSLVSVDCENVVIEATKMAENSEYFVVRLYECYNKRSNVQVTLGGRIVFARECNILEEDGEELKVQGQSIFLTIKPYEIKTLKVHLHKE